MSYPAEYTAWRRKSTTNSAEKLEKSTETLPKELKPEEVLIKIHAVSLNYRDVAMLYGKYPIGVVEKGIPSSDCSAEVIDAGSAVTDFKTGDRVSVIFDLLNLTDEDINRQALGGDVDGVLRQYAVFDQVHLYHIPNYLTWEEASTITCAGVTAWNALNLPYTANKGEVAFLQGTGGVSMFALILCLAAGIRPIISSSSQEKLNIIKKLATPEQPIDTVNYKTHPDWEKEVLRLTNGRGVDIFIENVGPATIEKSLASVARKGNVALVGFLGGFKSDSNPDSLTAVLQKKLTMRGIYVGSKIEHVEIGNFIEEKSLDLKPLINKVFEFDEANEAFDYLYSAQHSGKIIIKI